MMNKQQKFDLMLIIVTAISALTAGYSIRALIYSKHDSSLPTPAKQPINITVWVPDRDIKYTPGTLPGMSPKWKVGLHGKL